MLLDKTCQSTMIKVHGNYENEKSNREGEDGIYSIGKLQKAAVDITCQSAKIKGMEITEMKLCFRTKIIIIVGQKI